MASQSTKVEYRHFLVCPRCKKTLVFLSAHLRRVCMKGAAAEVIDEAVGRAKLIAMEILRTGIVFSYGLIQRIMEDDRPVYRLIEELERRHMVVRDVPPPLLPAGSEPRPSTSTADRPVAARPCESETAEESRGESNPPFEPQQDREWKSKARKLMADKGLYRKHSLEHPLLKDFGTYLYKDLKNENFKQEVENVARFMYYMDPKEPSLLFVRNREKTKAYLRDLTEAKLTKQTQMNYLKSLKRFLNFHTVNTDLRHQDEKLHGDCAHFILYIGSLQKSCSKLVSKEIVKKRYDALMEQNQPMARECWAVLDKAKADFLAVIAKEEEDPNAILDVSECLLVVYYLQAIVILKNLQRPGVVEHMTMKEWEVRLRGPGVTVVGVTEHKTSAQQVATFALDLEEETWFDTYRTKIRPRLLSSTKRKRTWGEVEAQNRFFISSTGRPIYNASNDLNRFHVKYGLKPITSQMARKIFETGTKGLDNPAKALVADYLTHSSATAEKHYRMRKMENVVKGRKWLHHIAGCSSNGSNEEPSPRANLESDSNSVHTPDERMTAQDAYQQMVCEHPVTLDGEVPDKAVRSRFSAKFQRQLYERWIKAQMKLRVQCVASHFSSRLPKEKLVSAWIARQGWKSNIPSPTRILADWKPSGSIELAIGCGNVRRLIALQKWKGLEVRDIPQGQGKGVFATRRFLAGEMVCEYHGCVISDRKARKINAHEADAPGCLFFFADSSGVKMAIDSASCLCHPGKERFCHHIRHSGKRANLTPRLYTLQTCQETKKKDVILFIAMKQILCDEELTFDYGDKKRLYRGEGLKLK